VKKLITSSADFEIIFKEYYNPLCNFINQYIKNWEDAREIVQTTFLNIWKARDRIMLETSVKSYLFQAAKNTMIDHIRKNKRNIEIRNLDINTDVSEEESGNIDALIIRERIEKACLELKPKNREIFFLNKSEGLTYEEIANHLNISKRAVEDNISRAIKLLREQLKNDKNLFD